MSKEGNRISALISSNRKNSVVHELITKGILYYNNLYLSEQNSFMGCNLKSFKVEKH